MDSTPYVNQVNQIILLFYFQLLKIKSQVNNLRKNVENEQVNAKKKREEKSDKEEDINDGRSRY